MCANVFICMCTITLYTLCSPASDCSTQFSSSCMCSWAEKHHQNATTDTAHSAPTRKLFHHSNCCVFVLRDDDDGFRKTALAHSLYNYDFGIGVDGQEMRFIIYSRMWRKTQSVYNVHLSISWLRIASTIHLFFHNTFSCSLRCFSFERQTNDEKLIWLIASCIGVICCCGFSKKLEEMTLFFTLSKIERTIDVRHQLLFTPVPIMLHIFYNSILYLFCIRSYYFCHIP